MRLSNQFSCLTLLLVLSFSSVYSSETRVSTMGQEGLFVRDESNIMLFPGTLLQYGDIVVSEMRALYANGSYTIGLHMDYGNTASALYINQPISSSLLSTGVGAFGGAGALLSPLNNTYLLMYALPLAGFDAGFGLMAAGTSQDNGTVEETARYIAILAGVSNKKLDAGLKIELPSIEQKNGGTTEFSGFGLMAQGRYNLMTVKGANIFPVAQFSYGSASFKNGADIDYSGLMVRLGAGVERQINENNLLIVGVEVFGYESTEANNKTTDSKTTVSTTTIPAIYVGIESRIASWLVGRIGVRHTNQSQTTDTGSEVSIDGSTFKKSLGLAMEFGNFALDFAINEGIIFDGPYVLSGAANNLSSRLSIIYDFGGEDEE